MELTPALFEILYCHMDFVRAVSTFAKVVDAGSFVHFAEQLDVFNAPTRQVVPPRGAS
jgi:hypothetical protein